LCWCQPESTPAAFVVLMSVVIPARSERRGQSQKPEEIYQLIEQLVPNGEQ
jgi:N6-adenosine-specific RNA methylase IME4